MARVVIIGASSFARTLASALGENHSVSLLDGTVASGIDTLDLSSIPEVEVALAGCDALVMLAHLDESAGRFLHANPVELNHYLTDTWVRAAVLVNIQKVAFVSSETVVPESIRKAGIEIKVIASSDPQLMRALIEFVGGVVPKNENEKSIPKLGHERVERFQTLSLQTFQISEHVTAKQLADKYFAWLPSASFGVKVEVCEDIVNINSAGLTALQLRFMSGRSMLDSANYEVIGGYLSAPVKANDTNTSRGRFEFRRLKGQNMGVSSLVNFSPAMPFGLYRLSQAIAHEQVMKRFAQVAREI